MTNEEYQEACKMKRENQKFLEQVNRERERALFHLVEEK